MQVIRNERGGNVVVGTISIFGIAGISFWLGIQFEQNRQSKRERKNYLRRCRLADKEVKYGFFSDTEPNI